jgi:hypothetical protein
MNAPFLISRITAKFGMGYIKVDKVDHDYCNKLLYEKKIEEVGDGIKSSYGKKPGKHNCTPPGGVQLGHPTRQSGECKTFKNYK